MAARPIDVETHSLIDYGFTAANVVLPAALGLSTTGRRLAWLAALSQGSLNALTDQPYAAQRLLPFKLHGRSEAVAVPALAVAAVATGAMRETRGQLFFGALLATLATVYALTGWNAAPTD